MTWEEAEATHPECSAKWDVLCQTAKGTWEIQNMYLTIYDHLTILVYSTSDEFRLVPKSWGLFQYRSGQWWMID